MVSGRERDREREGQREKERKETDRGRGGREVKGHGGTEGDTMRPLRLVGLNLKRDTIEAML